MAGDAPGDVDFEDYYDLLGVDPDADEEAIVRAYKRGVKTYHPDRQSSVDLDTDTAAEVFSHLSAARSILTNPARRAAYDRLGHRTYLLEHGDADEEPLRPVSTPGGSEEDERPAHDDAWYAATTPTPGDTEENAPVATGTVVEGEDVELSDLLGRDPLETAWRRFLVVWGIRTVALLGLVGAGLTILPPEAAAALAVFVLAASGVVAARWTPVTADPTDPPPSASVGVLRPSTAAHLRDLGQRSLTLALVLLAVALVAAPRPVATVGPTIPTRWLPAGALDAPKLQSLVGEGLTLAVGVALAVGVLVAVAGVSAGAWIDRHGNHRRARPWLWDVAAVAAAATLLSGLIAPPVAMRGPSWLWSTGLGWTAGGVAALLALTVAADRRLGVDQSGRSTSATTS